jgi:hypothetical protein
MNTNINIPIDKIGIAITTYNRHTMTFMAFKDVLYHPRVSNITIVDDASSQNNYEKLLKLCDSYIDSGIIKLVRNRVNLGMLNNKIKSAKECTDSEFILMADSDNIFKTKYIDNIPSLLQKDIIYMPDWGMPDFDYRKYSGLRFDKNNIQDYLNEPMFECLLNTGNWVVHRKTFINTVTSNPEIKGTDSIWFVYQWLKSGKKIMVVPEMRYTHVVHSGSEYLKDAAYNMDKGAEMIRKIENLKIELCPPMN